MNILRYNIFKYVLYLEAKWSQMTLTVQEMNELIIDEAFAQEENKKALYSLVGKLQVDRTIGKEVAHAIMTKVWKTSKPFIFIDICPNLFLDKFEH